MQNELKGMDKYLWDMNDFAYQETRPLLATPDVTLNKNIWIPPAPQDPADPTKRVEHVLVLNAQFKGVPSNFKSWLPCSTYLSIRFRDLADVLTLWYSSRSVSCGQFHQSFCLWQK